MANKIGYSTAGSPVWMPEFGEARFCVQCGRVLRRLTDARRILDTFIRTGKNGTEAICRICRPYRLDDRETAEAFRDPAEWRDDLIASPERLLRAEDAAAAIRAPDPAPPAPPARESFPPVPRNLRPFAAFAGSPFYYAPDGAILAVGWDAVDPPPFSYIIRWRDLAGRASGYAGIDGNYQTAYITHIPAPCTIRVSVAAETQGMAGGQAPSLVVNVPAANLPEEIAAFHLEIGAVPDDLSEAEEDYPDGEATALTHPVFGAVYAEGTRQAEEDERAFCLGCGRTFYLPESAWCEYCGGGFVSPRTVYNRLAAGQAVLTGADLRPAEEDRRAAADDERQR
jgi:hypothetical protein